MRTRRTMGHQSLSTIEEGYGFTEKVSLGDPETYLPDNGGRRQNKVIDSQRVYSALMRHIGETAARDGDVVVSSGMVKESPVIVERSPSVRTLKHHSSIHKMPSDLSMKTARTSFTAERRPQSSQSTSFLRSQDYIAESPVTPIGTSQIPQTSSMSSSRANTRDSKPAFFPLESSPRLKTPSPYKASMSSIREIHDVPDIRTSRINTIGAENDKPSDLDSPSVYSRTTSGRTASRDALDDGFEESFEPGMATIYDIQVPYKSPRRRNSPGIESGPRNSAEWKEWLRYEVDSLDKFDVSRPLSQREHHREDAESDGKALPPESPYDVISRYTAPDRDKALNRLQQIPTSRQDLPEAETRPSGQNNFSRPISRGSMASLRATAQRQHSAHEVELNHLATQRGQPVDPFFYEKPYVINNSPSYRQGIRAAREARLNRGMTRRNTLKVDDDQSDVKTVQSHSIREVPNTGQQNKENDMSPGMRNKYKGIGLSKMEHVPKAMGGSKHMVDNFLLDRRLGHQSPDSVASESVFV